MLNFFISVFWTGVFIVFYTYLGYGILLWILTKIKKKSAPPSHNLVDSLPPVTHIVAAYNEESFIEEKIKNSLSLAYPPGKMSLWIVTDGSSDQTPEIVNQYPDVRLFHSPERKGKIHAVNRVMREVTTPVVVFSDANTV